MWCHFSSWQCHLQHLRQLCKSCHGSSWEGSTRSGNWKLPWWHLQIRKQHNLLGHDSGLHQGNTKFDRKNQAKRTWRCPNRVAVLLLNKTSRSLWSHIIFWDDPLATLFVGTEKGVWVSVKGIIHLAATADLYGWSWIVQDDPTRMSEFHLVKLHVMKSICQNCFMKATFVSHSAEWGCPKTHPMQIQVGHFYSKASAGMLWLKSLERYLNLVIPAPNVHLPVRIGLSFSPSRSSEGPGSLCENETGGLWDCRDRLSKMKPNRLKIRWEKGRNINVPGMNARLHEWIVFQVPDCSNNRIALEWFFSRVWPAKSELLIAQIRRCIWWGHWFFPSLWRCTALSWRWVNYIVGLQLVHILYRFTVYVHQIEIRST